MSESIHVNNQILSCRNLVELLLRCRVASVASDLMDAARCSRVRQIDGAVCKLQGSQSSVMSLSRDSVFQLRGHAPPLPTPSVSIASSAIGSIGVE